MEEEKPSWENIPSLDGLEIDWSYEPENPMGNRAYPRLTMQDLSLIFRKKNIAVKLVTESNQCIASLIDVSQGGVCLKAKILDLSESQLVKIGFFLGKQKLISKGRVKYLRKEKDWNICGIEFVGLSDFYDEYLAGLYTSIKLKDRNF